MTGPPVFTVGKTSENNLIESAYLLAQFILEDKESAELSAASALARLDVAAVAQDRRYYYVPGGSPKAYGVRTKITLGELHLLQRLIYDETESYELEQEQHPLISDERLLKHFLKQLVKLTLKRNSFYVTLGISRLLHRYSTTEAVELYSVVVQNPSRAKDNHYWRSRKAQLMLEIKARFGELLSLTRGAYGEERFASRDDSPRYASFINDCLNTLMPWAVPCPLPPGATTVPGGVPALDFKGGDPDEEHRVEIARIHAVLHSECFARIVAGVRLVAPEARLEVPQFIRPNVSDSTDTMKTIDLDSTQMAHPNSNKIRAALQEEARRRRRAKPARLRVVVDRQERGVLDLNTDSEVRFTLSGGEEFLELRTLSEEGDIRLALYPIDYSRLELAADTDEIVLALPDGRKLNFVFAPQRDKYGEVTGAAVIASRVRPTKQTWLRGLVSLLLPPAPRFSYAMTAVLLIIGLTGGLLLWQLRQAGLNSPEVAVNGTPAVSPPIQGMSNQIRTTPLPVASLPVKNTGTGKQVQHPLSHPLGSQAENPPSTRRDPDIDASSAVTSLTEVKHIYIPPDLSGATAATLREQFVKQLRASGRWMVSSQEDAEAALNISARPGEQSLALQLVNANGRVIWPAKGNWRTYSGNEEQIVKSVIGDWLKAAR